MGHLARMQTLPLLYLPPPTEKLFRAVASLHFIGLGLMHIPTYKVHLILKLFFFSQNRIYLLFGFIFVRKKFWIYLNPRFSVLLKVALEVLHDRALGSLGRPLLMTSTQEPNTMAPQSAFWICSRKWKAKLIVPIYFVTKTWTCHN